MKSELIKEENALILLDKINNSIKSRLSNMTIVKEEKDGIKFSTQIGVELKSSISYSRDVTHYYNIEVTRNTYGFFSTKYIYSIYINIIRKDYNDDIHIKGNMSINIKDKIANIWNTLSTADEQKEIEKSNKRVNEVILDISTTVDKSFDRDGKLDEILN